MAYCTLDDIKLHLKELDLGQLTDDSGAGVVSTAKVAEAIRAADARIDGYLRFRYTLPLAAVSDSIRDISIHLSVYELYNRNQALVIPDQLAKDHAAYIDLLKEIRDGKFDPGVTDGAGAGIGIGRISVCSHAVEDTEYNDELWARFP